MRKILHCVLMSFIHYFRMEHVRIGCSSAKMSVVYLSGGSVTKPMTAGMEVTKLVAPKILSSQQPPRRSPSFAGTTTSSVPREIVFSLRGCAMACRTALEERMRVTAMITRIALILSLGVGWTAAVCR